MAISVSDPTVQTYLFYSAILALKVLAMSVLTGMTRQAKKVVANPEDVKSGLGQIKFDDPDVERVRRAHLNDLENIPVFWVLGLLYLTTNPFPGWAMLLFRVFAFARISHTFVYAVKPMPQPARGLSWFIAFVINVYMGVQVVLYYLSAM